MKPPMNAIVWTPPKSARPSRPAKPLPELRRITLPACGEDVAVDAEGQLLSGLADGRVVRVDPIRGTTETIVNTGGRPMCIEVEADGKLVICDAKRGLLRVDPQEKRVEVLADAGTHQLGFCNNAAIAADGTIYFSDSSRHFGIDHWRGDLLEHSGTGRLLKRSPDGKVELLLRGLEFANGVALAQDGSFVAVAETGAYRITRLWLSGAKAGQRDLLIDGLPGFPDNMASDAAGLIWVAIASPRNLLLDTLHRTHPLLRKLVWAVPESLQPKPDRTLCVMAIDAQGKVVHHLTGKSDFFHMVTGLRAHEGKLYLASLEEAALVELRI